MHKDSPLNSSPQSQSRRQFLSKAPTIIAGSVALTTATTALQADKNLPLTTPSWSKTLGTPTNTHTYGLPSTFESSVHKHILMPSAPKGHISTSIALTSSVTPFSKLRGNITPNGLFFERHHSGIAEIDPNEHRLVIHGLVKHDIVLTLDKIKRFPSVQETYFIECSGNTGISKNHSPKQKLDDRFGLMACAQWSGVKLSTLLKEAGVDLNRAKYIIAEGADGATMARTIPISRAMDDCLVAYAQNGEAIRPEQGYPLKLIVPGCEGNINIKWLRRLEVTDTPLFARDEVSKYSDLLSSGKARQATLVMDVKSVITYPSSGDILPEKGFYEIRGLAWSGRGKISHVDISVDGGRNWQEAEFSSQPLSKAFVEFTFMWKFDGKPTLLLSRAMDEDGYIQPYFKQITDARGFHSESHNNAIQAWSVKANGEVKNVQV